MVYYSLADDHVHQLVKIAHDHAIEGDEIDNRLRKQNID